MYDVVVIGGGPVGSYAAYRVAGLGHKVAVVEQKPKVGEKNCCTGIVGQECVNSFAIENNVILRKVNSARLFSPSEKLLRLRREETQAYVLDRVAFNRIMARRAQGNGAEYVFSRPVQDIEIKEDRVKIKAVHQQRPLNFEARAVIIATGFGSNLATKLGLGKIGDFAIGAQAEVATTGVDEVEVYFGREIAPGFFAWLVPTSPQTARVGLLSRHDPGLYLKKLMASLISQRKIAPSEVEFSYGGIPLKPLTRTYGERVLVIGDAAGQVKPTTGGGIYYGLLCADIGAETLHQALESNDLSARNLAKYERKWRQRLGWELKIGYWARKVFECLSDRQIDRLFDIVKANGIDETLLQAKELSFDWHGKAILKLIGHSLVTRALNVMKLPAQARKV